MDKKLRILKKNTEQNTDILLFKPHSQKVGGLFSLLIKTVICILSSIIVFNLLFTGFNIECDYPLMYKIITVSVLILAAAQINTISMIIFYCGFLYKLYSYITSNTEIIKNGIMTIANQSYSIISNSLNLPSADGFDAVMENTYLTVNSAAAITAVIISMIMVLVVVKLSSKLLYALGIALIFSLLSFFECTISYKYAVLLLICFSLVISINLCSVNSFKISITNLIKKKTSFEYKSNTDFMYALQTVIIVSVLFLALGQGFKQFYDINKFNTEFTDEYSENIKTTARDIAIMKYAEYKKFTLIKNVSYGQLGYMSYVKPNFKSTVFSFTTEPVTQGKLYFKCFTGQNYNYRYNLWTEADDNDSVMVNALKEAGASQKEYEINTSSRILYLPYYSEKNGSSYDEKNKIKITAYKYQNVKINDEEYNKYVKNNYLYIDDKNKAVIDKICQEQNFNANDSDLNNKIAAYFKNNFTYSTESTVLPYGKDFVNYFLEETKTGNFTHYASALTLIYRNLGIPARYISGYTVEAEQTLANRKKGKTKTTTNVKQANLSCWVETYNKDGGWKIIDIIPQPPMTELEEKYGENTENTYTPNTSLENYFRTFDKDKYSPKNIAKSGAGMAVKLIAALSSVVILLLTIFLIFVKLYRYIKYAKSDNSQKAYIIMENLKRKLKTDCTTYRELEQKLSENYGSEKAKKIIQLCEKCIFSEKVSDKEIKELKKLIKK